MPETRALSHLRLDRFTEPGEFEPTSSAVIATYGRDPLSLARATRDHMVHIHWRQRYGLEIPQPAAMEEASLRTVREKWARLLPRLQSQPSPLSYQRRLLGTCRDFTLMHCSLLRQAGIPARARCGFADYFLPGHREDHWITEWFDAAQDRWVQADAQLDALMIGTLKIAFSPDDLPGGVFTTGGEAWLRCRAGDDPERYGIFDMKGWDFLKGNLVRDLASLAGFPMCPWDFWGIMLQPFASLSSSDLDFLDELARALPAGVRTFSAERMRDARVALPPVIKTLSPQGAFIDLDISALLG
jgi:hypothetical protein